MAERVCRVTPHFLQLRQVRAGVPYRAEKGFEEEGRKGSRKVFEEQKRGRVRRFGHGWTGWTGWTG